MADNILYFHQIELDYTNKAIRRLYRRRIALKRLIAQIEERDRLHKLRRVRVENEEMFKRKPG